MDKIEWYKKVSSIPKTGPFHLPRIDDGEIMQAKCITKLYLLKGFCEAGEISLGYLIGQGQILMQK